MNEYDAEEEVQRPLALTLLSGLYLFIFLITVSSYGQPVPFLGSIHYGKSGLLIVFADSLCCLYLFLGVMKRQQLTWYLLLGYNAFEVVNTLTNLLVIPTTEIQKVLGTKLDQSHLYTGNFAVIAGILLLSGLIVRHRSDFTNHSRYLF